MPQIPKAYNPVEVEDKIYKIWEESGKFNPDNLDLPDKAEKFSIAMPPPNATGVLHVGHASGLTYEDIMIRYNRMKGKRALWLPGTDHAAIATQAVVEKLLAKEGKTKHDLGREKFLERINEFVENSKSTIRRQIRKMGSSCDWSRERYTLDEGLSQAVKEVFVKMYCDGLIYRGYRIVNWCPRCESTLADDEVEYKEQKAKLYYFKYQKDFPITIATTRPETKLGDTAVAVSPKDPRYKKYIGKTHRINLGNGIHNIKIIADRSIDMKFGTGALGVTPAHSMADAEMARKNKLPSIKVIDEKGRMTAEAGKDYAGLTVLEARTRFVEYLEKNNLLEKTEDIGQNISICYRCETPIEPLPSLQWFIDVNKKLTIKGNKYFKNKSLKEVAIKVVKDGEIKIIPERFEKIYFQWMENLRDWCISRQIWFGHRIPVWYRDKSQIQNPKSQINSKFKIQNSKFGEDIYVGTELPEGEGWTQDSDTLDTWFSSGMWTFSTLLDRDFKKYGTFGKWIKNSPDLKKFHPTSVMETGYDILFFWIARMILMTTYALGEIPFETVYLHGLVRDKLGRKMSKSLGNGIDPIDMIKKYGTDALRLSMIIGGSPGGDIKLYEEKIAGYRNFANKLWNISRYILQISNLKSQISKLQFKSQNFDIGKKRLTLADKWILNKSEAVFAEATKKIDNYEFSPAAEALRDFTWNDFADWYLEISKIEKNKDEILAYILRNLLKIWHPFIPFITEEIWSKFDGSLLMAEKWPEIPFKEDKKTGSQFETIRNIIAAIRNLRAENKIEPVLKIKAIFAAKDKQTKDLLESQREIIKGLARLSDFTIQAKKQKIAKSVSSFADNVDIYLPLEGVIDIAKELEKIKMEIKENEEMARELAKRLANKNFLNKAKKEVVEETRRNLEASKENLRNLKEKKRLLL